MQYSDEEILNMGRSCLTLESQAIQSTMKALDFSFSSVVRRICQKLDEGKKLIFTGVGKNVSICTKLTGTFNSTGVVTTFLDPNQALHGDLGMCSEGDLCFLISNSGETEDILRVVPFLNRLGIETIALTAKDDSSLARLCKHTLLYTYESEACPLNLAPTASTTAALAIGDSLAMACLQIRGFSRDDFAKFHPEGNLGKVLLLKVDDIMRTEKQFAIASHSVTVKEALLEITKARCGSIALTDPNSGAITGVFSDGDFRRSSLKSDSILDESVSTYMTRQPKCVQSGSLAVDALRVFESCKIDDLIVIDAQGKPIGIIDGQDMPRMRVV